MMKRNMLLRLFVFVAPVLRARLLQRFLVANRVWPFAAEAAPAEAISYSAAFFSAT